jgi:hypothetical protein
LPFISCKLPKFGQNGLNLMLPPVCSMQFF